MKSPMSERKDDSKPKLRKQPQMRRVQSATTAPMGDLSMPRTAAKRKRRNSTQRIRRPLAGATAVLLNARWVSLAIVALAAYALYIIGSDERFYLNYIPVEGASTLDINEVVAASGLAGRHIFAADPQEAADHIHEVQGVVTATVTLYWPNDVLIRVSEKPPLATWQEGDLSYWIDADGQLSKARSDTIGLLSIISDIPVAKAPVVTVADKKAAEEEAAADAEDTAAEELGPGSQAAFVPREVLAGALQLRELRPNIDKLHYKPADGLGYQDGRGWMAYFGTGRDMHQKLVVYETIVAELLAQGVHPAYISVANQYKPYYRLNP